MTITEAQAETIRNALMTVAAMVPKTRPWTFQENKLWGTAYSIVSNAKQVPNEDSKKGESQ